ncbi:MAG TPA: alpha/beta hydrolase [Ilumatobacter sp.]
MASVTANGITIEYEEQGTGDPLLLVMGLGGQLCDWPDELVDLIAARGFRVLRHDNRDTGLSTEFPGRAPGNWQIARAVVSRRSMSAPYRLSDMAADAAGLLDALGIGRAHVVGVSMGGMIAQTLAIEHPGRVSSLTSIMSTTGNRRVGQPTARIVGKFVRRKPVTRAGAVDEAIEVFREISGPTFDEAEVRALAQRSIDRSFRPAGVGRQAAAIMASPDRTAELTRLDVPTLVVHGLLDPLVRPSGGIATARAVPGSQLLMFNDMAHDLPRTRWVELADAIAAVARRSGRVAA